MLMPTCQSCMQVPTLKVISANMWTCQHDCKWQHDCSKCQYDCKCKMLVPTCQCCNMMETTWLQPEVPVLLMPTCQDDNMPTWMPTCLQVASAKKMPTCKHVMSSKCQHCQPVQYQHAEHTETQLLNIKWAWVHVPVLFRLGHANVELVQALALGFLWRSCVHCGVNGLCVSVSASLSFSLSVYVSVCVGDCLWCCMCLCAKAPDGSCSFSSCLLEPCSSKPPAKQCQHAKNNAMPTSQCLLQVPMLDCKCQHANANIKRQHANGNMPILSASASMRACQCQHANVDCKSANKVASYNIQVPSWKCLMLSAHMISSSNMPMSTCNVYMQMPACHCQHGSA